MADATPHVGGRYGIWGMNPYGPTIKQTPGIETALRTAKGFGELFAQQYANQIEQSKARLAQETLTSEIGAKNTKNEADILNYPLQQQAKTRQEQETISEIMARTGLSRAQAQHALASAGAENATSRLTNTHADMLQDPFYQQKVLVKEWEQMPEGTPQKALLGHILAAQFAGTGMNSPTTKKTAQNTNPMNSSMGALPGLGGTWNRDPRMGTTRGGAGGTYADLISGDMVSTDTNANTTQDQRTIAAVQRVSPLLKDVIKDASPFLTLSGKGALGMAAVGNLFGDDNELPSKYADALAKIELSAEGLIKAYGLNVTDQSALMMKAAIRPRFGESAKGYENRLLGTLKTIQKNQKEAEDRLREGTSIGQESPEQINPWINYILSKSQAPGMSAVSQPPQTELQQQPQSNAGATQLGAMAEQAVAKGVGADVVRSHLTMAQQAIQQGADPAAVADMFSKNINTGGR